MDNIHHYTNVTLLGKPSMGIDKHVTLPLVSDQAVSLLTETDVITASSLPIRIKIHGKYV